MLRNDIDVPPINNQCTLKNLQNYLEDFQARLAHIFEPKEAVIKTLAFFLSRQSSLFEAISQEQFKKLKSDVGVRCVVTYV